jgi:hypothetical protein
MAFGVLENEMVLQIVIKRFIAVGVDADDGCGGMLFVMCVAASVPSLHSALLLFLINHIRDRPIICEQWHNGIALGQSQLGQIRHRYWLWQV